MTRNYKFIPYKKIIEFESQKLKTTTKLEKKVQMTRNKIPRPKSFGVKAYNSVVEKKNIQLYGSKIYTITL